MEKYLIVGLGNIGDEYAETRHNAGFMVLDAFAEASNAIFEDKRYGFVSHIFIRGRNVTLLKPSTFMNLSGNSVRYWLNKENVDIEHLLVIVDDKALPVGSLRLRKSGSAGGHNGLRHIESVLCTQQYSRLRVGIGDDFPQGMQIDFVLGIFSDEERAKIVSACKTAGDIITSFILCGADITMNTFNKRHISNN